MGLVEVWFLRLVGCVALALAAFFCLCAQDAAHRGGDVSTALIMLAICVVLLCCFAALASVAVPA
jgi:thiol:disulfide interchange protein